MPRTKVSKSSKRSREASSHEKKLRVYENHLDSYLEQLERVGVDFINKMENNVRKLLCRTSTVLLQMKMADILEIEDFHRFKDWKQDKDSSKSICNSTASSGKHQESMKLNNPNDEGYLTEDSAQGSYTAAGGSWLHLRAPFLTQADQRGRTPGPLNSARARKQRRSRSACGDFVQPHSLLPAVASNAVDRMSRSKMRTPIATKSKAISADRSVVQLLKSPQSPAAAFLRWPKPGEIVLSKCGSPIVAQVLPEKYANVNIPIRDGVLSLRPKKLGELQPNIVNSIGKETLDQIKTLHANLNIIMNMAERAGLL